MSAQPTQEDLEGTRAPFTEHLEELRSRLIRALLAVVGGAIICWLVKEDLYRLIAGPLNEAQATLHLKREMVFRTPHGAFVFYLKIAVFGGLFLSVPFVLYQIWQFVAPGLYKHERRVALPFVMLSTLCFAGGASFCYIQVMPQVFEFLLGYGQDFGNGVVTLARLATELAGEAGLDVGGTSLRADIAVEDFLGITTRLLLAFGIAFELPVALGFFALVGLITHISLIRFWRYAVVIAFIAAAFLTPPDPYSQAMLAIPLLLLYALSIGLAWLVQRNRGDDSGEDDAEGEPES